MDSHHSSVPDIMDSFKGVSPAVIPWVKGIPLDNVMAALGNVLNKVIVRVTGGCANMSPEDAQGVLDLFTQAFLGFSGALLIGGTRMVLDDDPSKVLFGITEVGPAIRRANPQCFQLGFIPRLEHFRPHPSIPAIVVKQTESADNQPEPTEFTTIVHPHQDLVIAASQELTIDEIWDDEVWFCKFIRKTLVDYGHWQTLTVAYNGGGTTERELRADANRGWPVLIVKGSGRKCDTLAADDSFTARPNVKVCERNATSMRSALQTLGVVPQGQTTGGLLRAV